MAENWTPEGIPDTQNERAVFGPSNITSITGNATVGSVEFLAGASQYLVTGNFSFVSVGVINGSGLEQTFNGTFFFTQGATADSQVTFETTFTEFNSASAGSATYIDNGLIRFEGSPRKPFETSADNATLINNGQIFMHKASGGTATFINNGGTSFGADGAFMRLAKTSAELSTIIASGGQVFGGHGAQVLMAHLAAANNATLIANGGAGPGSGGQIRIDSSAQGNTARVEAFGNGAFDVSQPVPGSNTIGSLEGDGLVSLGATALAIGGNGLSTSFSGTISDEGGISGGTGGSITKTGGGSLELSGSNTYTGGTTVQAGTLFVNNTSGSGTGSSAVQINSGTIGGTGVISGAVTVGIVNQTGAILAPGAEAGTIGTLSVLSQVLFQSDTVYEAELNSSESQADELSAHGITITGSAAIALTDLQPQVLPIGTFITLIQNTAATPIAGSFVNLPDGVTITVGSNNFLVDYEGGDGNDLTLTVVP
jgi:autotransporter-associated beta strand protein